MPEVKPEWLSVEELARLARDVRASKLLSHSWPRINAMATEAIRLKEECAKLAEAWRACQTLRGPRGVPFISREAAQLLDAIASESGEGER